MKTNPFYLTSRIPPQFFCDREAETKLLLKSIENQENVVIMAQRRIGKTGLINHCFDLEYVRDNYYTVSIDILHTSSLKEFVKELGNAAFATVAQKSEKLRRSFLATLKSLTASIGYDPVTAAPTLNIRLGDVESPGFLLDEIFTFFEAADRPCIIAIDEFQRIANYPEKNVEELLYAVSAEKTATGITSGAFIKRHNLKSASAVQSAAKALIEAGILTKKGNEYSLSDPMTRIWLDKR